LAVHARYFLCSLNLVSLSVERPMLSLAPDDLSGAPPLRDRPGTPTQLPVNAGPGSGATSWPSAVGW